MAVLLPLRPAFLPVAIKSGNTHITFDPDMVQHEDCIHHTRSTLKLMKFFKKYKFLLSSFYLTSHLTVSKVHYLMQVDRWEPSDPPYVGTS